MYGSGTPTFIRCFLIRKIMNVDYKTERRGRFMYTFAVSTETGEYVGTRHIGPYIPDGYRLSEIVKGVYETVMVTNNGTQEKMWKLIKR